MHPKFPLNSTKNSADNTPHAATEIHLFNIENLATFSIETRFALKFGYIPSPNSHHMWPTISPELH